MPSAFWCIAANVLLCTGLFHQHACKEFSCVNNSGIACTDTVVSCIVTSTDRLSNCAFTNWEAFNVAAKLLMVVCRERSRVDGCGLPCKDIKTFHVVITRGSQPGQKHVMEDEADETADTAAGDLVFVLQQKPHAKLRRSGGPLVLLQMRTHLYECMRSTNSDSDHDIQQCL